MLSDDLTNLCRDVFLRARETKDAGTCRYLDKVAGRLQAHRDEAKALENAVARSGELKPVLIDLSDDKITMFPRRRLPRPVSGNGDGDAA